MSRRSLRRGGARRSRPASRGTGPGRRLRRSRRSTRRRRATARGRRAPARLRARPRRRRRALRAAGSAARRGESARLLRRRASARRRAASRRRASGWRLRALPSWAHSSAHSLGARTIPGLALAPADAVAGVGVGANVPCTAPGTPYSYGPPTTVGTLSKLNTGGGEETCHSIVIPRHGFFTARGPPRQLVTMWLRQTNVVQKCHLPRRSSYIRPVIFGNQ